VEDDYFVPNVVGIRKLEALIYLNDRPSTAQMVGYYTHTFHHST